MTIGEFKQLVREMRAAQRDAVESGMSQYCLRKMADLERQVDEAIADSDARAAAAAVPSKPLPPADLFGGASGSSRPGHAE